MFIAFFIIALEFLPTQLDKAYYQNKNIFVSSIGCSFLVMLGFCILLFSLLVLIQVVQSILFKFMGMNTTPVYIFPFCINPKDCRCKFSLNLTNCIQMFMPEIVVRNYKNKDIINKYKKVLKGSYYIQLISILVLMGISIYLKKYFIFTGMVFVLLGFIFISNIENDNYNGINTLLRNIDNGMLFIYSAKNIICFSNKWHQCYDEFIQYIENNEIEEKYEILVIDIIKNIIFISCYNNQKLSEHVENAFFKFCIIKDHYTIAYPYRLAAQIEAMKGYIFYCILCNNIIGLNKIKNEFERLCIESERLINNHHNKLFSWCLNICENKGIIKGEKQYSKAIFLNIFYLTYNNFISIYKYIHKGIEI